MVNPLSTNPVREIFMNKKLIVLSIAAAMAGPLAAQAAVEVYGEARASLDFVNNNDNNSANKDSTVSLTSNHSRLGFKGDEDLGNGLTALWQIEQDVEFDTGAAFDSHHARDTYIGLGGGFGTVLAGHLRTPYRASTTALDPFHDTRADHNAIIGSVNGFDGWNDENRVSNAIAYVSPNMNGFGVSAAYILSSADPTAGYEAWNKLGAGGDDASAWKIGGSYTIMDATTLGFIWETADMGGAVGDRDAWSLSAKHKMGDTTLMAAYSMADDVGNTSDSGAQQFSIGVSQALSKATDVYALYTMVGNDSAASYSLDNTQGVVVGQDMSAFSVGINHKFSSK